MDLLNDFTEGIYRYCNCPTLHVKGLSCFHIFILT